VRAPPAHGLLPTWLSRAMSVPDQARHLRSAGPGPALAQSTAIVLTDVALERARGGRLRQRRERDEERPPARTPPHRQLHEPPCVFFFLGRGFLSFRAY